jgi:hypothetical protein
MKRRLSPSRNTTDASVTGAKPSFAALERGDWAGVIKLIEEWEWQQLNEAFGLTPETVGQEVKA